MDRNTRVTTSPVEDVEQKRRQQLEALSTLPLPQVLAQQYGSKRAAEYLQMAYYDFYRPELYGQVFYSTVCFREKPHTWEIETSVLTLKRVPKEITLHDLAERIIKSCRVDADTRRLAHEYEKAARELLAEHGIELQRTATGSTCFHYEDTRYRISDHPQNALSGRPHAVHVDWRDVVKLLSKEHV